MNSKAHKHVSYSSRFPGLVTFQKEKASLSCLAIIMNDSIMDKQGKATRDEVPRKEKYTWQESKVCVYLEALRIYRY